MEHIKGSCDPFITEATREYYKTYTVLLGIMFISAAVILLLRGPTKIF